MITQAIAEARQDHLLRELLDWAELREACLKAPGTSPGQDLGVALAAIASESHAAGPCLVREDESGVLL
jgi:hypothetical protein